MDPELKARWVEALRSNTYEQGHGQLCHINSRDDRRTYCCLGVLADVMGRLRTGSDGGYGYVMGKIRSESAQLAHPSSLPISVQEEIGMRSDDHGRLISLNDVSRLNFHQIANWIEDHL